MKWRHQWHRYRCVSDIIGSILRFMSTSGVVLLWLAVLGWLFLIADLFTVVGETTFGDRDIFLGLRWFLAVLAVCAIWLCLGGLLWMAGSQGILTGWVNGVAVTVGLAAGAAC